jgi:hypothetical protein
MVRHEWSIKQLHRLIVLSSAYQMSSASDSDQKSVDPDNLLLHHVPVRRLEAESVRDAMLAVSGRLNPQLFGPSVLPYVTKYMEGRGRPVSGPLDGEGRRSVYINARRNFLTPLLLAFDYPVAFSTIGRRGVSTVPAQALTLMNDPFVVQQAEQWADRALAETADDIAERINWLYQTGFSRQPTQEELSEAISFVQHRSRERSIQEESPQPETARDKSAAGDGEANRRAVWADLCHVLMNVKEFIFID